MPKVERPNEQEIKTWKDAKSGDPNLACIDQMKSVIRSLEQKIRKNHLIESGMIPADSYDFEDSMSMNFKIKKMVKDLKEIVQWWIDYRAGRVPKNPDWEENPDDLDFNDIE